MLSLKRKTAVRPRLNQAGKPFRGVLYLADLVGMPDEDMADLLDRGWDIQMGGGTTPRGNQVANNPVYFPRAVVVSSDQTVNQGDMVWWDSVNFTLKPLTNPSQVAVGATGGYCGVAAGTNLPNVYPAVPSGVPSEALPGVEVQSGGSAWLNLQANDVVDGPFQALTQAGDAQTVTRGAATAANRVGLAIIPPPATPRGAPGATPVGETVQGGTAIRVWIERKFPSTALA